MTAGPIHDASAGGKPGVTVVIPAYNYAHFLPAAIDSALGQTYRPVEIIVVDDGSTDHTPEAIAHYGGRVRPIRQANAGLSAARNTGIRAASHPFIALLDADDRLMPERIERGMEDFERLPSDFGIVACLAERMDHQGGQLPRNPAVRETVGELRAVDILLMTRFSPSTVIARREVFEQCGYFDPELRSSEDRDMWIRGAGKWRVYLQDQRLALIRKHSGNMSSHADRMKFNMGRVIGKAWQSRVAPAYRLDLWLQVQAIYHYQTALIYHGLGRRFRALRDASLGLLYWPLPISARRMNSAVAGLRLRALWRIYWGDRTRVDSAGRAG